MDQKTCWYLSMHIRCLGFLYLPLRENYACLHTYVSSFEVHCTVSFPGNKTSLPLNRATSTDQIPIDATLIDILQEMNRHPHRTTVVLEQQKMVPADEQAVGGTLRVKLRKNGNEWCSRSLSW